jgi:diguanylate cyclase (GGDEF)-like protein
VVFLILCVAVLNLALGYGLALYLQGGRFDWAAGRGLSFGLKFLSWVKEPDEVLDDPPADLSEADEATKIASVPPVAESKGDPVPTVDEVAESVDTESESAGGDFDPDAENRGDNDAASLAFRSLAAALPTTVDRAMPETLAAKGTVPFCSATSEAPVPATKGDSPQRLEVDEDAIAAAIEGLKSELSRYRGEITTLDARLRQCAAAPDAPTVEACASDLREANQQYLEQQDARREELQSRATSDDAPAIVRDLAKAIEHQTAAVATAQTELADLDLETDLLVQCRQMLKETQQISQTSEDLHSTIGDVLDAMTETAHDSATGDDRKTSTDGRPEFVTSVEAWWQANSAPNRRLAAAMIEPDHLDRLTGEHGQTMVSKALRVFDSIVKGELTAGQVATRPNGDIYLLLMPDVSPRDAVRLVERCRQQIDATRFRNGNETFRMTVSCSVAASDRIEDAGPLIARLEAMLHEAKRYGCNRTFFQEGDIPAPAVPPTLSIEPQVIDLDAAVG